MTAKEEAIELLEKYYDTIINSEKDGVDNKNMAKECAKIHVDGIIKALEEYDERTEKYLKQEFNLDYQSVELQNMDSSFRYWEKIKKELELL